VIANDDNFFKVTKVYSSIDPSNCPISSIELETNEELLLIESDEDEGI